MKKNILLLLATCSIYLSDAQVQNQEYNLLRNIAQHRTASGIRFHKTLSSVNDWICLAVPAGIATGGFISGNKSDKQKALFIGETIIVSSIITQATKHIINRDRPAEKDPTFIAVLDLKHHSFPSGHTSIAFSTATALTLSYPRWYVWIPAYSYAALAGYSRLYLGVHYPTDVLAGALTGSGSAFLSRQLNKWLFQKKKPATAINW